MSTNQLKDDSKSPFMKPDKDYNEINSYVVIWGIFYACLFALAVGYLCLKIGQTVDAFAPVSILAMGMAVMLKRANPFPETVHIQAIASSGTNILAGAMFILPALYILNIEELPAYILSVPIILGGVLGVFIASIFRRYFCVQMDKEYPFPSGRAAAGVLTSNSGNQAKIMIISGAVGMIYDFILNSLGWWSEIISTTAFNFGQAFQDKFKMSISLDNDAALLGIGYFTGLRYAAIIAAGSFFSYFVVVPVLFFLAGEHSMVVGGKTILLADAPVSAVYSQYARHIGIGMLAMAGVIGLLSMSGVVSGIVKKTIKDIFHSSNTSADSSLRNDRDLPNSIMTIGMIMCILVFGIFFHIYFAQTILQSVIATAIVAVLSFLLSVVGISSIAFTGNEPVSGMTIFMMLFAGVCLNSAGLVGNEGIVALLMLSAFLASTVAVAGNFMSELKVAHITGATPEKMEKWQIIAIVITAIASVGVMILLNHAYGFIGENALNAPQANAMAAIAGPLMSGGSAPWPLYIAGAFFAVILWMIKVPPLAFALGAYLPMAINTPVLTGGIVSYLVSHSSKDASTNESRLEQGGIVASGLIAGGAIGSLISAILHIFGLDLFAAEWNETPEAVCIGIVVYAILCVMIYSFAMKAKK